MTAKLWRDWDQEGLDKQLNLRARWPKFQDYFRAWETASQLVRERLPRRLDVAYGPTAGQKLDFFPAAGTGPAPMLVFIHGGYWQALDKSDFSYLAPPFVEDGIAFVSLNYDLAPGIGLTTMVRQIERALAWLAEHAAELGCDARHLVLAGHSAGGHLTLITMIREAIAAADGGPKPLISAGCAVSGVYDLVPLRRSYHQQVLRFTERETQALSPLRHQPAGLAPLVVAVGDQETEEFLLQQDALVAQWQALGLPIAAQRLAGDNHFEAVDSLGERDHPLHAAVTRLCRPG
jgi:arylformamidase